MWLLLTRNDRAGGFGVRLSKMAAVAPRHHLPIVLPQICLFHSTDNLREKRHFERKKRKRGKFKMATVRCSSEFAGGCGDPDRRVVADKAGRGRREILEKTRPPTASPGPIPTCSGPVGD
ncbi:hypothetical protein PR048_002748 [Dryococelus australis]|uniref:Uncharacterized protein n=1 Tax=Dryococelus australis TaxID=614101 RepID=A0ABQ9IL73_9NEOP|nr:hypothetical protein PR048_002748 [Dryococelus australis]